MRNDMMAYAIRSVCVAAVLCAMLASCAKREDPAASSGEVARPEAIREDPWPPRLADVPVDLGQISRKNYIIIFDGSGSMTGHKIATAKAALKRFIMTIPRDANVGLVAFDRSGCTERASLGTPREKIVAIVDGITAGGYTPLGGAFTIAYDRLVRQANRQSGYGEYHIVVLTDGRATDGRIMPQKVAAILAESPVVIHTIGFQIGSGHALNQPGRTYYTVADNFEELSRGLVAVLAELETFTVTTFK